MNPEVAEKARLDIVTPWVKRAERKIVPAVANAAAHAEKALTRSAIDAANGRQTWRTLNGQRSHKAAQDRLDELCEWLVGKTAVGLEGLVQDARVDFYRRAFGQWRIMIPPEILDANAKPKSQCEDSVRGLTIFGLSPYQTLEPTFATAKRNLMVTLNAAASESMSPKQRSEALDSWQSRASQAIYQKTASLLSNSEVAIATMVGHEMIRPELRAKSAENAA